jgi:hypothetical protein
MAKPNTISTRYAIKTPRGFFVAMLPTGQIITTPAVGGYFYGGKVINRAAVFADTDLAMKVVDAYQNMKLPKGIKHWDLLLVRV